MSTETNNEGFWIRNIEYNDASETLKRTFDRVKSPEGAIDNVLKVHSLRPHTLKGHMTLYKSVLHHSGNELPKWYLEALGVYVSHLNQCEYCVAHHMEGLRRIWKDGDRSASFERALKEGKAALQFGDREAAGFRYAEKLTLRPSMVDKADIDALRELGFTDGETLEINQVASYFNYVNRTVLGLGVHLKGDLLGLSPGNGESPDDWTHQ